MTNDQIVTRFAPSPTGFLHIGGARTALFNYLFAKANGGKYLLRIEDTDRERSTQEAVDAILRGLEWIGLEADASPTYQAKNSERHAEIANELLEKGAAYKCYVSADELAKWRKENPHKKFRSPYRDGPLPNPPLRGGNNKAPLPEGRAGGGFVLRLRAPDEGEVKIHDLIQEKITVQAEELDDMILLRSDGTPTYMLAVVVDDHDMGITHVIRGDDHLTNTFRQKLIYDAMGWKVPEFGHMSLIHGPDGKKLSKRHGALGVEEYQKMGYLPEAMRNYLLRLGWSHGDDEIISDEQAKEWFNLEGVGKSPARFDFDKLNDINAHYIKQADDSHLVNLIGSLDIQIPDSALLTKAMPFLKERSNTLLAIYDDAKWIWNHEMDEKAKEKFEKADKEILAKTVEMFETKFHKTPLPEGSALSSPLPEGGAGGGLDAASNPSLTLPSGEGTSLEWNKENLEKAFHDFLEANGLKFGQVGPGLRALLTGTMQSPGVFDVMNVLGREESIKRLNG